MDSPNTFVNLGEDFVSKLYREAETGRIRIARSRSF